VGIDGAQHISEWWWCLQLIGSQQLPVVDFGEEDRWGFWWFARTKRHLTFESCCERDYLIALDFDPSVCAVAEQPFTIRFAAVEGGQREHTPDFFVRSVSVRRSFWMFAPLDLIDATDQRSSTSPRSCVVSTSGNTGS